MKKKLGIKRLFRSFKFAFAGYCKVYLEEPNMKIHTVSALLVIILGFYLKISSLEWIFLVFTIGLVIGSELINTAIENVVDLATEEFKPKAKVAKDTAAAYVLVLSMTAVIIGLIIFIPKIIELIGG